jgi:hypothetical protein
MMTREEIITTAVAWYRAHPLCKPMFGAFGLAEDGHCCCPEVAILAASGTGVPQECSWCAAFGQLVGRDEEYAQAFWRGVDAEASGNHGAPTYFPISSRPGYDDGAATWRAIVEAGLLR